MLDYHQLPRFLLFTILVCTAVLADKIVMTNQGPVRGITLQSSEVEAFLGIPYAEPPVGSLRFQRPVPKVPWTEVYDTTAKSPPCAQNSPKDFYYYPDTKNMTEDCLYLNLWVPSLKVDSVKSSEKFKAIIIYLFGGVFSTGSSDMDIYDGATLAAYGNVVVATINYRVGALGFLSAFVPEADGNMGIYDHILAIEWIKANAKVFGGDPEQITLMGENVGAVMLAAYPVMPRAQRLFKRVILQSGAAMFPLFDDDNHDRLLSQFEKLVKLCGCADDSTALDVKAHPQQAVACLMGKSADEIANAEGIMRQSNQFTFFPRTGDDALPKYPTRLFREALFDKNLEVLMGFNKDEGTLFLTVFVPEYFGKYGHDNSQGISKRVANQMLISVLKETGTKEISQIANYYIDHAAVNSDGKTTSDSYSVAVSQSLGDFFVTCNAVFQADMYSMNKNPVYFYKFSHRPEKTYLAEWMGTTHLEELQFVFGVPLRQGSSEANNHYKSEEIALSRRMMDRWLAFAKTGNPNIPGGVEWPLYTFDNPRHLVIDIEEAVGTKPADDRCDMWRKRFEAEIDDELIEKFKRTD